MGIKLYVGNLSFSVESSDLSEHFSQFGTVDSAKVIMDRETGRSKGFAFVEMADKAEGMTAIEQSNGVDLKGRNLKVNEALPQESRGPSSFGNNRSPRRY